MGGEIAGRAQGDKAVLRDGKGMRLDIGKEMVGLRRTDGVW